MTANQIYLNFDIKINHLTGEKYSAFVDSPSGQPPQLNFSKSELMPNGNAQNHLSSASKWRLFDFEADSQEYVPFASRPLNAEQAQEFGERLFSTIFPLENYTALIRSLDTAANQNARLRIRLNLTDAPELAVLPWEYLYHEDFLFLAKDRRMPVVRFLNRNQPIKELLVSEAPLRILVMISAPSGVGILSVEEEWKNIKEAFDPLKTEGLVELEKLEIATLGALEENLTIQAAEKPFHVLHYIGHGAFNKREKLGSLMLEDQNGQPDLRRSIDLARILLNYPTLRLVVLNSCEGASVSAEDSYSGTAQDFLQYGNIPAVVAMQYPITDPAALVFSRRFYQMIAKGQPIDDAVWAARQAMSSNLEETEWATPVLYMRSASGNLFDLKKVSDETKRQKPQIVHPTEKDEIYDPVVKAIVAGNLVPFIGLDANLYGRQEIENWQPGKFLPSSMELAKYLALKYKYPFTENLDLISVSQYALVKEEYIVPLYNQLSAIFSPKYPLTPVHNLIAKIPIILQRSNSSQVDDPLRRRMVAVTNNFDNQLDDAFRENQVPAFHVVTYMTSGEQGGRFHHAKFAGSQNIIPLTSIDDPSNYSKLTDPDPVILKLPGAFEVNEQRFAITEDHYSDYLTYKDLSGLLPPQLKGKLKTSHHLFLGASLRNWHLRALLYRVWEGRKPGNVSWVVHPNLPLIDKEFWQASRVKVIEEDFDACILELDQRLQNI